MSFTKRIASIICFVVSVNAPISMSGCGKTENTAKAGQAGNVAQPPVTPVAEATFKIDARLAQPFREAVLHEPPDGQMRPPESTVAGKSVGRLYEQIAGKNGVGGEWEKVAFYSATGQRLQYTARLETELGPITIELWPEVAPNHVRNFIALARVGYYDGLSFDRIVKQTGDAVEPRLELVSAGCPLGTGEAGYGSIGYWLRPEVSDKVSHEPGTVGSWHGDVVESAACKFYITLCKAPFMDGYWTAFGKVTSGLELARAILERPRREGLDRPAQPVLIRKVVVTSRVQGPV